MGRGRVEAEVEAERGQAMSFVDYAYALTFLVLAGYATMLTARVLGNDAPHERRVIDLTRLEREQQEPRGEE